jgi:holin-like protein
MDVLRSFCILLLAQLMGETLHRALHLPLPGPVLGMALLALFLLLRKQEPDEALVKTSNGLLRWLGLLFVPAGAGVVVNLGLLRTSWLPIAVALVVSTLLTITVTACVMQGMLKRGERVEMTSEKAR